MRDDLSPLDPRTWFTKPPAVASVGGSASGSTSPSAITFAALPARTSASSPAATPDATPLPSTLIFDGKSLRCRGVWSNASFAKQFLDWITETYPEVAGAHIRVDAIRELLPIFRKECRHRSLKLGALLLGLGEITTKRELSYRSSSGKRRVATEYFVPAVAE